VPTRRVSLVWRKSFPRLPAIEALRRGILDADLQGVTKLSGAEAVAH
jgi:LysR family hydrogen peroxide-inducible transcriptional activator